MSKLKTQNIFQSGFTLIELVLYIALVAIFLTGAIYFVWDVIYGREKAFQQQIVNQNARFAMTRIAYEIRRAEDIQSVSAGQLILDNGGGGLTTIALSSNTLQITTGGVGPYNLTSNQVRVVNLDIFTNLSSADENSNNIKVKIVIEQAQEIVSGQLTAETSLEQSVELNSQFNQSRRLLVDLSAANLVSGTSLEGMTIQDTGTDDVIIDKLNISWTGTPGGENITAVQIGAGGVEWTGSQGSGSLLELNDFTLATVDGVIDIDYLTFDSSMDGATLEMDYVLSDGSVLNMSLTLQAAAGTPTPSPAATPTPTDAPTPTPTPAASCSDYCIGLGYSTGTCRKNTKACNDNGETREALGDQYCTGGPNADTCCCLP